MDLRDFPDFPASAGKYKHHHPQSYVQAYWELKSDAKNSRNVQAPQVLQAQLEEDIFGDDPRACQYVEHALDLFRMQLADGRVRVFWVDRGVYKGVLGNSRCIYINWFVGSSRCRRLTHLPARWERTGPLPKAACAAYGNAWSMLDNSIGVSQ